MSEAIAVILGIMGFFGLTFAVERLPIKIAPLSWIKKFLTTDLENKVDSIKNEVIECQSQICVVDAKVDLNEVDRIKQEILTFRLLIKSPRNTRMLDFQHIFQLYDKYHKMGGNSVVDIAIEEIREVYKTLFKE